MGDLAGTARVQASFATLLDEHGPALERLPRAYEADAERQRALHQDILAALWGALPTFEGRSSLRTWAFRVAHNTALAHVTRAHRGQPLQSLEAMGAVDAPAPVDLEGELERRTQLARLERLLHELRPADRALMLLYLEGLTAPEMAEVTGLSVSNVSVKVHRIKALLKQRVEATRGSP